MRWRESVRPRPPTVADLQRRVSSDFDVAAVVGSADWYLVRYVAGGRSALAVSRGSTGGPVHRRVSHPAHPADHDHHRRPECPVSHRSALIPGCVPAGLTLARLRPGASEAIIIQSFGTVPAQDRGRPGGPRGLLLADLRRRPRWIRVDDTGQQPTPLPRCGCSRRRLHRGRLPRPGSWPGSTRPPAREHPVVDGRRLDLTQVRLLPMSGRPTSPSRASWSWLPPRPEPGGFPALRRRPSVEDSPARPSMRSPDGPER